MSDADIANTAALLCFIFVGILALMLYMLPAFIGRRKRNRDALFALNLLLGWTFIGWIICLVWALTEDAPLPQQTVFPNETESQRRLREAMEKYVK